MKKVKDTKIVKKKSVWLPILNDIIALAIQIVRGNPKRLRKDKRFKLIYIKLKEVSALLSGY